MKTRQKEMSSSPMDGRKPKTDHGSDLTADDKNQAISPRELNLQASEPMEARDASAYEQRIGIGISVPGTACMGFVRK